MQFVAPNVAKVELDSTSATFVCNVARKVAPCVQGLKRLNCRISRNLEQFSIECRK